MARRHHKPEEIVGKNLTLLLPDKPLKTTDVELVKSLHSGVVNSRRHMLETVGQRKDGRDTLLEIVMLQGF